MGAGITRDGLSLDHENVIHLIPRADYEPIMKAASDRLPELDEQPHDLYEMLFSKEEELPWLRSQYRARHDISH